MSLGKGDVTGIRQVETSRVDAQRGTIAVIRIYYMLRGSGPFVIDVDKDGFSGQKAVELLTRDASERLMVLEAFGQE